jgi:hypothetical protein
VKVRLPQQTNAELINAQRGLYIIFKYVIYQWSINNITPFVSCFVMRIRLIATDRLSTEELDDCIEVFKYSFTCKYLMKYAGGAGILLHN